MNEEPKKRWGCMQWGVVVICFVVALPLVVDGPRVAPQRNQIRAVKSCQQIILFLRKYAQHHEGKYPDGQKRDYHSANEVFRELFKDGTCTDERIFGCPTSPFFPDNEMGKAPDFANTLRPGECHWMLLKHQNLSSHPETPVIIENSLATSWPPKWNLETQGQAIRGRAWPGHKIIIGRNDGSVALEKLRPDGTIDWHAYGTPGPDGKRWIDTLTPEQVAKLSYWDIEEK